MTCKELIFLRPMFRDRIWGGHRLQRDYKCKSETGQVGEAHLVSASPKSDLVVVSTEYAGMRLSELYRDHRELFGDIAAEEFPLSVKLYDTRFHLPVYAVPERYRNNAGEVKHGAAKFWYVLDCDKVGAKLVLGHIVDDIDDYLDVWEQPFYHEIMLRKVPVEKEMIAHALPGTVHGMCKGSYIYEVAPAKYVSFVFFDYHRNFKGNLRKTDMETCTKFLSMPDKVGYKQTPQFKENVLGKLQCVGDFETYQVFRLKVNNYAKIEQSYPFLIVSVLEGEGSLNGIKIKSGSHFIVPCGYGEMCFVGKMLVMMSTVKRPAGNGEK